MLLFFQIIDPLPEIDHSDIDYEPFNKNFYEEHPEIQSLTQEQVAELRNKLGIRVYFCDLVNLNHWYHFTIRIKINCGRFIQTDIMFL